MKTVVPSPVAVPPRRLSGAAVVVLAVGALDFALESSIIVPALPALVVHYETSIVVAAWLGVAFILAAAVAVPICGRLGDMVGKKRMILVSLGLFTAGSMVCAATSSIEVAIAGRVIQGLGAAVVPLALGLARDTVPPEILPRVVGIVLGASGVGAALGFLLSGVLVDAYSAAAIFWFLAAVGAVLAVAVAVFAPESPVRARVSLDYAGALLLSVGLASLMLAISQGRAWGWGSARIVGLVAVAAVTLVLFVVTEVRRADPLVDLALVRARPFANVNVCGFLFGFAFFIGVTVVPLIAGTSELTGYGVGLSVTEIGLILVPTAIAGMIGGWSGGRLLARLGPRAQVLLGGLLGVIGYVSLVTAHDTALALAFGSAVIGIGWGLVPTGYLPVVLRSADVDKSSVAVSIVALVRNVGTSMGVTAAFSVVAGAGLVGGVPPEAAYERAFVLGAVAAAALALLAAGLPARAATER
jgi:EmrB/QacA subfamily drug resistance transporter